MDPSVLFPFGPLGSISIRTSHDRNFCNANLQFLRSPARSVRKTDSIRYNINKKERWKSSRMDLHNETNANGFEKLLCNGINQVEVRDKYILPPHERPNMSQVSYSESIPVVDLKQLGGPNRSTVIQQIRRACQEDGFFQIVNHGVPETVVKNMMGIAKEFFEMPVEDRACLYSEDPKQLSRLATSFNVHKDEVLNWRDYLRHPCLPLEEVIGSWPKKPAAYREIAGKYAVEVRALALRLLAAISEALGLHSDYLNNIFGEHRQLLLINYYPPCPNPDLALGLKRHSDAGGITVLMQGDVSGLQVLRKGKWVAVEPITNAFVINLGDQLEVVSNGRFRSVEHRAITNARSARISIPTSYGPSEDAFIAPAASLVDEQHPCMYRGYKYGEFSHLFFSQGLKGKTVLDHFKIHL
jgi:isopenicillin N synthase-like dioxygenase